MADDKGGGGGSGWSALEIILVILLIIALLDRFTGKGTNNNFSSTTPSPTESSIIKEEGTLCGLTLLSPQPLEKIYNTVTLRGNTDGCDWNPKENTALYAQVVDSRGTPISAYIPIAGDKQESGVVMFNQTISLSAIPGKGIGYLILVPATPSSSTTSPSARIPLTFSK